jgi:hypothetical protein
LQCGNTAPALQNKSKKVAKNKGKHKMTQFIREVVARLSGKAVVHAKCADIKGRKSGGTRDISGQDWYESKTNDTN